MVGKVKGTVALLRQAGRTTRAEHQRAMAGALGRWFVHLELDGLSDERREEILARLRELTGRKDAKPVGDGRLHLRSWTGEAPLRSAVLLALAEFSSLLDQAGVTAVELRGTAAQLTVEPGTPPQEVLGELSDRPTVEVGRLRARVAKGAGKTAYGLAVTRCEFLDMQARQEHGDRTHVVFGALSGLNARALDGAAVILRERFGAADDDAPVPGIGSDRVSMSITAERTGTPLGGMLIAARGLGDLLALAPAAGRLRLVSMSEDEYDELTADPDQPAV